MRSFRIVLSILFGFLSSAAFAQEYVEGEIIVKLKSQSNHSGQFMAKSGGRLALKKSFKALGVHQFGIKSNKTVRETLEELRNDPDVEYAEPNYIVRKHEDDLQVDSTVYSFEQAISIVSSAASQNGGNSSFGTVGTSSTGTYSQSTAPVQVTEAWQHMSVSSANIPVVAIVDTGLDPAHSVFASSGAVWTNIDEIPSNGLDDDHNGFIDDVHGWNFYSGNNNPYDDDDHGTHVAGIVLGVMQNIFASPMAPAKIRIMPLKFLGADGTGSTSDAISAIYYAVNNGANIINNSWGGAGYSQALHEALKYAYDHDVFIATAAGNYHYNNDAVDMYPANYPIPSQITVAATTDWDSLASFSDYGGNSVHLAAPGVGIFSTVPGNSYVYMSGTSMASPFVAGLAALAKREAPQLNGYQIKNLILNSGDYLSILDGKVYSKSRGNALKVVNAAIAEASTSATSQPVYAAVAPARSPASDSGKGGCGTVSTAVTTFGGNGKGNGSGMSLVFAFTLLPLIAWMIFKAKTFAVVQRRKHDRFVMNSEIKVNIGGRELVGQVNTISVGGLSFNAEALLEKGGVVNMTIESPDGSESVQVQGHIVWSEKNKAYGVQFDEQRESIMQAIRAWTIGLLKAS